MLPKVNRARFQPAGPESNTAPLRPRLRAPMHAACPARSRTSPRGGSTRAGGPVHARRTRQATGAAAPDGMWAPSARTRVRDLGSAPSWRYLRRSARLPERRARCALLQTVPRGQPRLPSSSRRLEVHTGSADKIPASIHPKTIKSLRKSDQSRCTTSNTSGKLVLISISLAPASAKYSRGRLWSVARQRQRTYASIQVDCCLGRNWRCRKCCRRDR